MTNHKTLRLTKKDVPDGSLIAVFSDVHIPHQDDRALTAAIECCEAEGVTHIVAAGDIGDCGVVSRHENKRVLDTIDWGTLAKACRKGRYFIDWVRTRPCYFIRGNHERWAEFKIETDDALRDTVTPEQLMGWPEDGDGWTVLPSYSKLRIGSLDIEHGDGPFASGNGGKNPARRLLDLFPNQTTIIGHLHRADFACHTFEGENGFPVVRAAYCQGHLSLEREHVRYAGTAPNWQKSFSLVRVYWEGDRAKYTVYPIIIFTDGRGRAAFDFGGRRYRG